MNERIRACIAEQRAIAKGVVERRAAEIKEMDALSKVFQEISIDSIKNLDGTLEGIAKFEVFLRAAFARQGFTGEQVDKIVEQQVKIAESIYNVFRK